MDKVNCLNHYRPSAVKLAIFFLIISLLLSWVQLYYDFFFSSEKHWNAIIIGFLIIGMMTFGLMVYLIYMRKNWARIVFSAIIIFWTVPSIRSTIVLVHNSLIFGIIDVVATILQIAAVIFLFRHESNQWYKTLK